MNEDDIKIFLDDFKNADVSKKLDMWYFALEQGSLWDEVINEIANIAQIDQMKKTTKAK